MVVVGRVAAVLVAVGVVVMVGVAVVLVVVRMVRGQRRYVGSTLTRIGSDLGRVMAGVWR